MKALVGAFNQEKALVGAFSVIVQPVVEPMEHYTALLKRLSRHGGRGGSMLPAGLSFPEAGAGAASPGSLAQAGPDCVSRHIVVVR